MDLLFLWPQCKTSWGQGNVYRRIQKTRIWLHFHYVGLQKNHSGSIQRVLPPCGIMSSFPKRWKNWNSCRWNSSGSFHAARNLPKQNGQIPKKVLCLICLIRTQTEMCQSGHRFEWRGWKHVSRLLSQSTHSWKMKPQICTDKTQQSFNLSYSPPASRLRLRRQNITLPDQRHTCSFQKWTFVHSVSAAVY